MARVLREVSKCSALARRDCSCYPYLHAHHIHSPRPSASKFSRAQKTRTTDGLTHRGPRFCALIHAAREIPRRPRAGRVPSSGRPPPRRRLLGPRHARAHTPTPPPGALTSPSRPRARRVPAPRRSSPSSWPPPAATPPTRRAPLSCKGWQWARARRTPGRARARACWGRDRGQGRGGVVVGDGARARAPATRAPTGRRPCPCRARRARPPRCSVCWLPAPPRPTRL